MPAPDHAPGFVSLVGAGPWDPELLTLAGRERLSRAEVVIVDYLVNPALLMHCPADALILQRVRGAQVTDATPRLDQARINELMVEHARAGRYVVRLKGGDPMMFGRGAEEACHLRGHGVGFEFVPGVSSPIAAPEAAGIPITHRDHTPCVSFVSGYEAYQKSGQAVAWRHLANNAGTLVLMMSVANAGTNAAKLVAAGRAADTPAAVVRWGTRGIQECVVGTLADIAERTEAAKIRPPAVMIVGEVVALREQIAWLERRPLFGRRVVVTRAARQSGGLVHLLAAQGADAVAFPCLDFVPPSEDEQQALEQTLARVEDYSGVIVSSPNGVEALFDALGRLDLDARLMAGKQIAAIGTGTAAACEKRGLRPDLVPGRARSEGLIELLSEGEPLKQRWLHIRADEGRSLLAKAFEEAGGSLQLLVGYRTIRPEVSPLLLHSLQPVDAGGEGVDAVCFASGRTARHYLETTAERFGESEARTLLEHTRVIAIGPVTAAAVEALGIQVHATAQEPSDQGLLEATLSLLARDPAP